MLALSALFLAQSPPAWVRGAGAGAGSAIAAVAVQAALLLLVPSWQRAGGARRGAPVGSPTWCSAPSPVR